MLGILQKTIKFFYLLLFLVLFSCKQTYHPKPKGLNKINLPQTKYSRVFVENGYSFEKNTVAKTQENKEYGWFNLSYFNQTAELLLTYKKISSSEHLDNLFNESYKLVSKHQNKATGIVETDIKTSNDHRAKIIDIKGEVPTPFQFIVTDSTNNFLRAALYFERPIKGDSLLPVVKYIKQDMLHLLNTLSWNE